MSVETESGAPGQYTGPLMVSSYDTLRFDVRAIIDLIRQRIILFSLLFALVLTPFVLWAVFTPDSYDGSVVVAPVSDAQIGGGLSSLVGGLGGLSSFNFWGAGSQMKNEALATLNSRELLSNFIIEKNALPQIFGNLYNWDTMDWEVDDPEDIPTVADGVRAMKNRKLKVDNDLVTGMVTVRVRDVSPERAANWANELVARANQVVRDRTINETRQQIAYLEEQVAKTPLVELQQAIYRLLEQQYKKIMVAEVTEQYALRVIDPAVPADLDDPAAPSRLLIIFFGLVLASIFATGTTLLWGVLRQK